MKIHSKIRLRRKPLLNVLFFVSLFVFASFTKEDRQKVRTFKLELMKKYVYHLDNESADSLSSNDHDSTSPGDSKNTFLSPPFSNLEKEKNAYPMKSLTPSWNVDQVFDSEEKQGVIGEFSEEERDNVSDNFFTITLPELKSQNVRAFLQYDLFGLNSYQSVSRSINKNIAFGGEIIVPGNTWTSQKEEISLQSLIEGKNSILFTSSYNGVKYKVKNVKIIFEKSDTSEQSIHVVSTLLSENSLYVKGIEKLGVNNVNINQTSFPSLRGEYEATLQLSEEDKNKGFVSVATSTGVQKYIIPKSTTAFKVLKEEKFNPLQISISKDSEYKEQYQDATISIDENSVSGAGQIEILKLRKKDFPAVSGEIKSLTSNAYAYRLNTRFGELTKKVKLSFPYDEKKLGTRSAKEIKAFYFDYALRKWKVDPTSTVNTETKTVTVESDGNGDYINGIISVPESPQLGVSNPTSMSGLKAGDPLAGLQVINPPTANQKGSANVSYPIVIPSGRKGMQPGIAISYDSNKSNGWMGEGWDVNGLSSISLDTRWGSPKFDSEVETELYSLDGEMLVYDGNYLPHRHNDISETSTVFTTRKQKRDTLLVNNKKVFFLRKNHDFTKIERYGSNTKEYRWIVTSTNGTKTYYGGDENAIHQEAVIKTNDGDIASWAIWKTVDIHGNNIQYEYENFPISGQTGDNENLNNGIYFHIKKITYTGKDDEKGLYSINFERENTITRDDINMGAKLGVKTVEPYRLNNIIVKYEDTVIRRYNLSYITGQFYKTLLYDLIEYDGEDKFTNQHRFNYYDDLINQSTGATQHYGPNRDVAASGQDAFPILPSFLKPSKISANNSLEWGVNARVPGVGLSFIIPTTTNAYGHVLASFSLGHSEAEAKKAQELMDFDGDGIQDLIYRKAGNGLFLRPGTITNGLINFGQPKPIKYLNSNFSLTKTKTNNIGYDAGIKVFSIQFNFSQMWATSKTETSSFILDSNSDGVMDVVKDGEVIFGRINPTNGDVEMTKYSDNTENMVIIADAITEHSSPLEGSWQDVSKNDVVKVWIAPMDGYINFEDQVQVENVSNAKAVYSVEIKNPLDPTKNGRIFLKEFTAGMSVENIAITNYNTYYSQIQSLSPSTTDHLAINSGNILHVQSGDKVFIRLHKNENYSYKVFSNPLIKYVNVPKDATIGLSQDGFLYNNGTYKENFLLNNHTKPISIDVPGTVKITVPSVTFSSSQDDITFKIISTNTTTGTETVLYSNTYSQSDLPFATAALAPTIAGVTDLTLSASDVPCTLRFVAETDSHISFKNTNWNRINVDYSPTSGTPQNYTAVADYPSLFITEFNKGINIKGLFNPPSGTQDYKVQINKMIPVGSGLPSTGSFYYIVKKGGHVLTKRRIIAPINSQGNIYEIDMTNNQVINGVSPAYFTTEDLGNPVILFDPINIQVYCNTKADYDFYKAYSAIFNNNPFNIYYGNNNTLWTGVNHTSINSRSLENIGQFYHNWGQFLYNEYADVIAVNTDEGFALNPATPSDNYGRLINLTSFEEINVPVNLNFPACNNLATPEETAECIAQQISNSGYYQNPANFTPKPITPLTSYIEKRLPDIKGDPIVYTEKWIGIGAEQYAMEDSFKDNESATGYFNPQLANPDVPDDLTLQGNVDTKMYGIGKKYYSKSKTTTLSGSLFNFGAQNAHSVLVGDGNIGLQDYMDMNGDGYPDVVYKDAMQLTNSTGGHRPLTTPFTNAYISNTDSYSNTLSPSYSASIFTQTGVSSRNGEVNSTADAYSYAPASAENAGTQTSAPWSAQVSANYDSKDSGESYWMDVNGDGMADRVTGGGSSTMKYQLNLGSHLDDGYTYKNAETYASGPVGSVGLGGGFDFGSAAGNVSVSVSANAAASMGSSKTTFEDINGDGLVDILIVGSTQTFVKYNLGNKFSDPVELFKDGGGVDYNNESKTYSGGLSVGVGYYYNFLIVFWPFPFIPLIYFKVGGQVSGNLGLSIAEADKAFKDMNGDGYPDLVISKDDGFIVNHSTIGRTNKLKTVERNIGIDYDVHIDYKFIIDYEFSKPSYNDPHGRLVMKEVNMLNPDATSGSHLVSTVGKDMITRYKYDNGHHDRRERDFFGFEKITTQEIIGNNTVYRSNIQTFYNNSYFLSGVLRDSKTYDASGNLLSASVNTHKLYKFKDNNTKINLATVLSDSFDTGGKEGRKMAIVLLDKTESTLYESSGNLLTTTRFTYNDLGQMTNYQYTSPSTSYNSVISYHSLNNNILNVPKTITVNPGTASSNYRYRETEADPNTGDITKIMVQLNGSETAETQITYDTYGNIETVIYPPNNNAQSYSLNYKYDPVLNKYVERITDSFNLESVAQYDPKFDVVTETMDASGNTTKYTYDAKGRIISILAPKEMGVSDYTVSYQYYKVPSPQTVGYPSYMSGCVTENYDPQHPHNPITTMTLTDGLGRVIQVKKDIFVGGEERMSVSGRTIYDQLGREVLQYHPIDEDKDNSVYYYYNTSNLNQNLNLNFSGYYSSQQYDYKDRVVTATDELFHTTSMVYTLDNNLLKTTTTLYQNNSTQLKSETFVNAEGKTEKSNNYLGGQALTTLFNYNTLGQLISVNDPEGITTDYSYDYAGRKYREYNSDRGLTYYTYDKSGNLTQLETQNIMTNGQPPIEYKYDQNRLIEVRLPDIPSGDNPANVMYKYGPSGSGNNSGKLVYKRDNSGETHFEYGNMGEVLSENRTIVGYNIPLVNMNTQYTYDSWNRIQDITYPDGELVIYTYDIGGNLIKINNKEGYEYVKDIQYDYYGQRTSILFGNDTKSEFAYSPADRRLTTHTLKDNGGNNFLSNNYAYDYVGNITSVNNTAQPYNGGMGGNYNFDYVYDQLNRLQESHGAFGISSFDPVTSDYATFMTYNKAGGIVFKDQMHNQNSVSVAQNTFNNQYTYITGSHQVSHIDDLNGNGSEDFEYDMNGNVIHHSISGNNGDDIEMYWDEQDRLKAYNSANGVFQYYVYDDKGERIIKYNLEQGSQLYQNGSLEDPGSLNIKDYKIYPNPYVVLTSDNQMTKNYFAGSQRVASRLLDFDFSTMKSAKASSSDLPDPETDFKTYLGKAGINIGTVTMELNNLMSSTPDVYYLHGDHLGTATFVTDSHANPTQFFLNLPFGETMVEQMTGAYDNPYKFNAKELDSETSLYYYGARYYNPRLSIWYGVDPLAGKMPGWSPYAYTLNNPINLIDPTGMIAEDPGKGYKITRDCYCNKPKTPILSIMIGDSGGPWGEESRSTSIIGNKTFYNSDTSNNGGFPKIDEPNSFIQAQLRIGGENSNTQIGLLWMKEKYRGENGFKIEAQTALHASIGINNVFNSEIIRNVTVSGNASIGAGAELGKYVSENNTENFSGKYQVVGYGASGVFRADLNYKSFSAFVGATVHISTTNPVNEHSRGTVFAAGMRAGVGLTFGRKEH